jgi:hypothetical protein
MRPWRSHPTDIGHDESDDVLLQRLTALARAIDPLPTSVAAQARAAGGDSERPGRRTT